MNRLLACAALALAVPACSGQPTGADGYRFEQPEFERTALTVRVVMYNDEASLRAALPAGNLREDHEAMAWGRLFADGSCEIHILAPSRAYAPEWIGHELTHCIHGRWHS